jgi:hypothetical protein
MTYATAYLLLIPLAGLVLVLLALAGMSVYRLFKDRQMSAPMSDEDQVGDAWQVSDEEFMKQAECEAKVLALVGGRPEHLSDPEVIRRLRFKTETFERDMLLKVLSYYNPHIVDLLYSGGTAEKPEDLRVVLGTVGPKSSLKEAQEAAAKLGAQVSANVYLQMSHLTDVLNEMTAQLKEQLEATPTPDMAEVRRYYSSLSSEQLNHSVSILMQVVPNHPCTQAAADEYVARNTKAEPPPTKRKKAVKKVRKPRA